MKILFVAPSYKPAYIYGGTIVVIAQLAETLVKMGHEVTVYTTTANGAEELPVTKNTATFVNGVEVFYFKRITKDHTHASPALWGYMNKTVKQFDIVHIHSWWNFLVLGAVWVCKRNGVKPIVSPHGMLSTYIFEKNNSLKKRFIHFICGKKLLASTFLHVSTEMELKESQAIIPGWEGSVITNLVTLSSNTYTRPVNEIFTIGFLSRIDHKKGLEILLRALSKVAFPFKLKIAGSGEESYVASLKAMSISLGISQHLEWVGWKNGNEKFDYLSGLDLFALTSHSENFAIVVIESLSVGTPVLISDQVGLCGYILKEDLGWVTSLELEQVVATLEKCVSEKAKSANIQSSAAVQIHNEYSDEVLTDRYVDFYTHIIQLRKK
jgi:glycosyltransferase involved in cell wall biosynthesis